MKHCLLSRQQVDYRRLRERFRGHHIFHDVRWDREVRYLAYRTASGVQPDTVITDDLAELREQLEQAAPPDLGTGLFLLIAQEPGIGDGADGTGCVSMVKRSQSRGAGR